MYTIKYDREYVNEILGGEWEGEEEGTYYQDYWLRTESDIRYAMKLETLEEAQMMLQEIREKVDYVTYNELEIEEIV